MTSKWEVHLILKPKIHLIVHWYLPKIQEEAYKVYPSAWSLYDATHTPANAQDSCSTPCRLQKASTSLPIMAYSYS